jgi:arylsulfatase A-like enzyme
VLNELHGYDHSGTTRVGTPAIFGMNFQTVSTAQKLPASDGQPGGYEPDGVTPGPLLRGALDYINAQIGAFETALAQTALDRSTAIVLSAKHGQSPQQPQALTRIPDGPILDGLNAAWKAAHPSATTDLVAFAVDDDAMLIWLNDRSQAAADFAKQYLLTHSGTGNDIDGDPKPYTASGLAQVYTGQAAAGYFGTAPGDARRPDLFGIVQHGVVYTGGKGKIAEHGGADPQDTHVPLVVSGAGVGRGRAGMPVETTQIAPTILHLLGLRPDALRAVQLEQTAALPLDRE